MNYIMSDELREMVMATVAHVLSSTAVPPLRFEVLRRSVTVRPEALLAANAQKVARLMEADEDGAISMEDLRTRRAILEEEARQLRQIANKEENRPDQRQQVATLRERMADVLPFLRSRETPAAETNRVLAAMIDRIVVSRGARLVEVCWRWPEDSENR